MPEPTPAAEVEQLRAEVERLRAGLSTAEQVARGNRRHVRYLTRAIMTAHVELDRLDAQPDTAAEVRVALDRIRVALDPRQGVGEREAAGPERIGGLASHIAESLPAGSGVAAPCQGGGTG